MAYTIIILILGVWRSSISSENVRPDLAPHCLQMNVLKQNKYGKTIGIDKKKSFERKIVICSFPYF